MEQRTIGEIILSAAIQSRIHKDSILTYQGNSPDPSISLSAALQDCTFGYLKKFVQSNDLLFDRAGRLVGGWLRNGDNQRSRFIGTPIYDQEDQP
jgi:hypothetical protein